MLAGLARSAGGGPVVARGEHREDAGCPQVAQVRLELEVAAGRRQVHESLTHVGRVGGGWVAVRVEEPLEALGIAERGRRPRSLKIFTAIHLASGATPIAVPLAAADDDAHRPRAVPVQRRWGSSDARRAGRTSCWCRPATGGQVRLADVDPGVHRGHEYPGALVPYAPQVVGVDDLLVRCGRAGVGGRRGLDNEVRGDRTDIGAARQLVDHRPRCRHPDSVDHPQWLHHRHQALLGTPAEQLQDRTLGLVSRPLEPGEHRPAPRPLTVGCDTLQVRR